MGCDGNASPVNCAAWVAPKIAARADPLLFVLAIRWRGSLAELQRLRSARAHGGHPRATIALIRASLHLALDLHGTSDGESGRYKWYMPLALPGRSGHATIS